ncbi:MAG: hypothetical protein AAGA92_01205 [Planctomycetota bacterium]
MEPVSFDDLELPIEEFLQHCVDYADWRAAESRKVRGSELDEQGLMSFLSCVGTAPEVRSAAESAEKALEQVETGSVPAKEAVADAVRAGFCLGTWTERLRVYEHLIKYATIQASRSRGAKMTNEKQREKGQMIRQAFQELVNKNVEPKEALEELKKRFDIDMRTARRHALDSD